MATMRSSYPIMFNTTTIPFPSDWQEDFDVVESEFQTEAGTDTTIVTRDDKLIVSASFKVLSDWAQTFGTFSRLTSFTLKRYNPSRGTYEEKTVRMRDFSCKLVPQSQDLPTTTTTGVWQVSFKLKEF